MASRRDSARALAVIGLGLAVFFVAAILLVLADSEGPAPAAGIEPEAAPEPDHVEAPAPEGG